MSNLCEQLKQLRLESGRLFPKGYVLLEGLSPSLHKLAYKFADDHHELVARLERKFPKHPRDINWDKADKYAGTTLVRHCHDIVHSLKSAYAFFEDLSMFHAQALELLNRIHRSLGPISLKDGPNALVSDWMALFCDILCLHLLVQRTPKEKILQIYSAAYYAQNRQDPPHYADICTLMTSISDAPVQRFQQDMSHFDGRIKQILESIACPILSRFDSTLTICQSTLLSMDHRNRDASLYPLLDAELDIPKSMTLKYLMEYQSLENWVLFGVLACPGVCESAFLRSCLRKILAKSHHLHVYRDLHEPIHELFRENIYAKLTELYQEEKAKILKNSTTSHDIDADFSQTTQLVSTCHSWRDTRSDILTTKGSVSINNKTHARRSFTWNGLKGDKAPSRTCKSFGSMLTSSFSFSERSVGQSSEDPEEAAAMKTMRRLDHISCSFPDDIKTRKWRAKMEIRELITVAEEESHATAQRRHAAGCYALCNVLDNILAAAKVRPDVTVHALDEILTAVSLGRLEIMWEVVRCSQLAIPHKKKDAFHFKEKQQDGQKNKKLETNEISLVVGFLLERTIHVQSLLLKYRTAICHHKIQALKRQYRSVSVSIHQILRRLENQVEIGMRLVGHFEGMEIWMKELRFPSPLSNDTEEEETLARPSVTSRHRAGEEFWIWDRLSDFRDAWKCVEYTLSDVESPLNIGTLLNMGCEDVLFELKQTALDVLQVGNFVETISNLSSLKDLAFYESQVMDLILLNFKETATPESSFDVLCLLHVFSQFHKNDIWGDDPFRKSAENEFVETAERCGVLLIVRLEDFIRDLFMKSTMPSGPGNQPPKTAQLFELLVYWFSTIGKFGTVEVIPSFIFNAADFLNSTVVSILRDLMLEHGLREDGIHGFRLMKKTYMDLLCFLAELQSVVDFQIMPSVHSAIFGLVKPDVHNVSGSHHPFLDSLASDGEVTPYSRDAVIFNEQCLVTLLADAISTNIIRDPRNMGIIYDPRKKRFIKREADARPEKWVDVGCSVVDLRCLLSVFGIVGVQQLEIQFRSLIFQSIGKLDAYLKEHSEMLKNMTLAFSSEKELIDSPALHHLASQLRNLPALGDITLQFSRSVITRQLLSDAYALQIENSGGAECMTALQLSLPQPTEYFHDLPPSPEPIMVEIFHDLFESKQLDCWMYIPALFACLAHDMIPNVKSFNAESGFFANGLHQIVYTLHSVALALETVYQNTDEDEREAANCPTSESFTLLFAKCLAMFTFHSKEKLDAISNTCLLLHSVCGGSLSIDQLEEIGLTPTRVKSAQISAQKRHAGNLDAAPSPLTSQ